MKGVLSSANLWQLFKKPEDKQPKAFLGVGALTLVSVIPRLSFNPCLEQAQSFAERDWKSSSTGTVTYFYVSLPFQLKTLLLYLQCKQLTDAPPFINFPTNPI